MPTNTLFLSAVQNLVCPWYTYSWALEQLGLSFQEAAELPSVLLLC
jgi:hypothetical protein